MTNEFTETGELEVRAHSTQWVTSENPTYARRRGSVRFGDDVYGVFIEEQPSQGGGGYRIGYAEVESLDTVVDPIYFEPEESATLQDFPRIPRVEEAFLELWEGEETGGMEKEAVEAMGAAPSPVASP